MDNKTLWSKRQCWKLRQFAKSETCKKWLFLVNRCVCDARQTRGIYQVLPYSVDFKTPDGFVIHWVIQFLVNVVLFGIKDLWTSDKAKKLESNFHVDLWIFFPNFRHWQPVHKILIKPCGDWRDDDCKIHNVCFPKVTGCLKLPIAAFYSIISAAIQFCAFVQHNVFTIFANIVNDVIPKYLKPRCDNGYFNYFSSKPVFCSIMCLLFSLANIVNDVIPKYLKPCCDNGYFNYFSSKPVFCSIMCLLFSLIL